MSVYHNPVLLSESISNLITNPSGTYADATFGGGGHSRETLSKLSKNGRLLGFDRDSDAEANAPEDTRFTFVHNNFRFILSYLFLLFFGTLHSHGYIFPFLPCFSLLFFLQLYIRPP